MVARGTSAICTHVNVLVYKRGHVGVIWGNVENREREQHMHMLTEYIDIRKAPLRFRSI